MAPLRIDVFPPGQLRMKAGADLEQAGHLPLQLDPALGWRVMRLRSFSSVDLPAPLRPMMPTGFALLDLEGDILQCPEFLRCSSGVAIPL